MANPSAVWAQLALPYSPVGDIPFVDVDGVTIVTDSLNYYYRSALAALLATERVFQQTVFGGIRVGYSSTVFTPGTATINKPAGRVKLAAGASAIAIFSTYYHPSYVVLTQLESADTTLTKITVVAGSGFFSLVGNAAATADVTISFFIVGTIP